MVSIPSIRQAEYAALEELLRRVDGLPLALKMAGSHIARTGVTYAEYLRDFEPLLLAARRNALREWLQSSIGAALKQAELAKHIGELQRELRVETVHELLEAAADEQGAAQLEGIFGLAEAPLQRQRFRRALEQLRDVEAPERQVRPSEATPCACVRVCACVALGSRVCIRMCWGPGWIAGAGAPGAQESAPRCEHGGRWWARRGS